MMLTVIRIRRVLALLCLGAAACAGNAPAYAQSADPADQVCARSAPGSALPTPPELFSENHVLEVTLKFVTVTDAQGLQRYCYQSGAGLQTPTLHVSPGDQLIIHLQNALPPGAAPPPPAAAPAPGGCSADAMGASTTNLHFHGMNVPPVCHQDDVLGTLVQPAATFDYIVQIPADEPPGVYWYHPHPHGFSEAQVLGGGAGALIVEGIESASPVVAGLQQRLIVLRDQRRPLPPGQAPGEPQQDLSVNFVPVTYPAYVTPTLQTPPATKEFWRVLNASADGIFDLQYRVNDVPQPLQIVAVDGIPVGQGSGAITTVTDTHFLLGPGARVEFIVTTPALSDQAQLITQAVDAGPLGRAYPARPLATISAQAGAVPQLAHRRLKSALARRARFATLAISTPDARRKLFFSENFADPGGTNGYFITLDGHTPKAFTMGAPPDLVLHEGVVEEWTVENRSPEDHVFHIHQLHFQVLAVNGTPVSDPALRDTINVPHWSGSGPYPSVTLRMDFRDPGIVGTFVYHCHILGHEDNGMMAALQLLPAGIATATKLTASAASLNVNAPLNLTAQVIPAVDSQPVNGTVQFALDGVPIGAPVPVKNGQATYTTSFPASGQHALTAAYSGDSDCNESLSEAATLSVEDFSLSAAGISIAAPGQSGTAALRVSATDGFSSPVQFACTLPPGFSGATCALNPATLTGAGTTELTITTRGAYATNAVTRPTGGVGLAALAGLGLFLASGRRSARRITRTGQPRARRGPAAWLLSCAAALLAFGCSSGDHSSLGGTPPGTYSVSVSAVATQAGAQLQHTLVVPVQVGGQ
jgi:FtsP/CotA-like multicopper oxidase with cupredoxin domain